MNDPAMTGADPDRRALFVCGCPRSGTTALWDLLNAHPRIVLGKERYGGRMFRTDGFLPALFTRERFFAPAPGDTFYTDLVAFEPAYAGMAARFDQAAYVGDKIPKLYARLPHLAAAFPGATVVFILRNLIDVADSYARRAADPQDQHWGRDNGARAAIADWNAAMQAALALLTSAPPAQQDNAPPAQQDNAPPAQQDNAPPAPLRLLILAYEDLFLEAGPFLPLFEALGLPDDPALGRKYRGLMRGAPLLDARRGTALTSADRQEICRRGAFGPYRQLLERRIRLRP